MTRLDRNVVADALDGAIGRAAEMRITREVDAARQEALVRDLLADVDRLIDAGVLGPSARHALVDGEFVDPAARLATAQPRAFAAVMRELRASHELRRRGGPR